MYRDVLAIGRAGGKGTRLGPYTTILPKPLLPVGAQAILEVVVSQLRRQGFTDMVFAVGYLAHLIQAVFGDGSSGSLRSATSAGMDASTTSVAVPG